MSTKIEGCGLTSFLASVRHDLPSTCNGVRRIATDESGAIMLVGVFMGTCVAGMLWYLAGIGDAILYRERMQEGADAVALSAALLHARGMNLIVLLNLIMACILGIRVALKAVQVILVVLAIVLAIPLPPVAAACAEAAEVVQGIINVTRAPINNTIRALSFSQNVIKRITPAAALAGSYQVGQKYQPTIAKAAGANPLELLGLPVEEGSQNRLCLEAGNAVLGLVKWVLPLPIPDLAKGRVMGRLGGVVKLAEGYFCELAGGGGGLPDSSEAFGDFVTSGCEQGHQEIDDRRRDAEQAYADASNQSSSDTHNSELMHLQQARTLAIRGSERFDQGKCEQEQRDAIAKVTHSSPVSATVGSTRGMTPKKVKSDFKNGGRDAQVLAIAQGNLDSVRLAPPFVKIAAWNRDAAITVPQVASVAFAQAEFFFDCAGRWHSEACNGDDDESSMWHFRWRARLRRYDSLGHNTLTKLAGFVIEADAVKRAIDHRVYPKSFLELPIVIDLGGAAFGNTFIH